MRKARGLVLFLVGLCLAAAYRQSRSPVAQACYRFRLLPEDHRVLATLELDRPGAQPIEIFGALDGRLLRISNLHARNRKGDELAIQSVPSVGGFPRYRVDANGSAEQGGFLLSYEVETGEYLPPEGHREIRQCGTLGPSGCALSLPNLALIPSVSLSEVQVSTELPAGWEATIAFPARIRRPTDVSWWDGTLVAAGRPWRSEDLGASVTLHHLVDVEARTLEAVRRIVAELEQILGPPAGRLDIVLAPFEGGRQPAELPGFVKPVVADLRQSDPESLRSLARALVPRWIGLSPAELLAETDGSNWFAVGLCEYLSQVVPETVWAAGRRPLVNLEWTWMAEPGLRELRPGKEQDPLSRRFVCAALVHDLARTLATQGDSLESLLSGYRGRGTPDFQSGRQARLFADFVGTHVAKSGTPLTFEAEWDVPLERAPEKARASLPIERQLEVVFTSDTEGYLEGCGCKSSQSGGVAQRAGFLAEQRRKTRDLLLVDLGNFSPVENGRARLDPITEEEFHLYQRTVERMGYDAVCVGPGELYSGCQEVRSSTGTGLPLTGLGIRIGERTPYPASRVLLKSGLRIGLVAYSELLEWGPLHQAQEPNMLGVAFPHELGPLLAEVARLRPSVDLLVVAGRMAPSSLRELCRPANGVDLVLVGGFKNYPPLEARSELVNDSAGFVGNTAVAFDRMGFSGVGVLSLLLSSEGPVAVDYRPHAILPGNTIDPEVQEQVDAFSQQLGSRPELVEQSRPLFAWDSWQQGDYAGTKRCEECHAQEARQWRTTPHAAAMETLKRERRDRHPKCVKCHVVGLGTESGFQLSSPSADLVGVACEVCHGAGARHARSPGPGTIRRTPGREVCLECHDEEHSENFPERFTSAWSLVTH